MKNHDDLMSNEDQKNMKQSGDKSPYDNVYSLDIDESETLYSSDESATCGDYCGTTAPRYLEVLEFTHFVTMFEFDGNGENYKNKKLIDRITVSVVLDLGCGNTTENVYESE